MIEVQEAFDAESGSYALTLTQHLAETPDRRPKQPQVIILVGPVPQLDHRR